MKFKFHQLGCQTNEVMKFDFSLFRVKFRGVWGSEGDWGGSSVQPPDMCWFTIAAGLMQDKNKEKMQARSKQDTRYKMQDLSKMQDKRYRTIRAHKLWCAYLAIKQQKHTSNQLSNYKTTAIISCFTIQPFTSSFQNRKCVREFCPARTGTVNRSEKEIQGVKIDAWTQRQNTTLIYHLNFTRRNTTSKKWNTTLCVDTLMRYRLDQSNYELA